MRLSAVALAVLMLATVSAQAGENLWCKVKEGKAGGAAKAPRTTAFVWNAAHGGETLTPPVATSVGRIDQGEGPGYSTVITVDGKAVPLAPAASGIILFGKIYDFGDKIAVVFLVETATDSSASPSEALVLIGKGPRVLEQGAISGQETSPNRCPLL